MKFRGDEAIGGGDFYHQPFDSHLHRLTEVSRLLVFLFYAGIGLVGLSSCGPTREPLPPGVIPQGTPLTGADHRAAREARASLTSEFPEITSGPAKRKLELIVANLSEEVSGDREWTVTLLDSDQVQNAAATRGNQIFVWTGMLKSVRSDDELAAVLAHEVAHVLAGHVMPTQEETLRRIAAQLTGVAATRLAGESTAFSRDLVGGLASQTAQGVFVNPYTQALELEADLVGFFLMADAGYDPRAALKFWERPESAPFSLDFFSTHPPSDERRERIAAHLDEALRRYRVASGEN